MAYSSSDTSGSGSGRSRSLKLQPTATGPMDLSEFYTNKGYVSETWWKDYFMTVMNDVVCASSVEQLEAKIPKYFDRDYVQHVDGKTIGYDEFVEHMKVIARAAESSRRPPRHRRDVSMAHRSCTARSRTATSRLSTGTCPPRATV